jgi:hypothetical protein
MRKVSRRRRAVWPRAPLRACLWLGALALLVGLGFSVAPAASSRPFALPTAINTGVSGAACISSSDCWAVGFAPNKADARLNTAQHWNGRKWSAVPTPDPGGKASGHSQLLAGASCVESSDCWAVGSYENQTRTTVNEALHWTGKRWKLVSTPDPLGKAGQELSGVSCVSKSDCWAVGGGGLLLLNGPGLNEVLHWNGSKWRSVKVPNPGGTTGSVNNYLRGVSCVTSSDCWAVGIYRNSAGKAHNQALHWNGKKWLAAASMPNPGSTSGTGPTPVLRQLLGVACPSTTVCRAVGSYPNKAGATVNEALRLHAKKWSVMPIESPGGTADLDANALTGLACTKASDCWAVGGYTGASGGTLNQALHFNGRRWSVMSTPDPGGRAATATNRLETVACVSAKDCWAMGVNRDKDSKTTKYSDEMLHWNGKRWSKG